MKKNTNPAQKPVRIVGNPSNNSHSRLTAQTQQSRTQNIPGQSLNFQAPQQQQRFTPSQIQQTQQYFRPQQQLQQQAPPQIFAQQAPQLQQAFQGGYQQQQQVRFGNVMNRSQLLQPNMDDDQALMQAIKMSQLPTGGNINPHAEWSQNEEILTNVAPPTSQTGNEVDIDLEKCLSINVRLGSDAIKAKDTQQTLPLLLNLKEVRFDELEIEVESKIDLVCVIDISGSMCHQSKMEYVKRTMKKLLEFLGEGHRLAIVLFDDTAQTYMNFKLVNDASIVKISEIIESIDSRGGTNITAGVHEAQKLLGERKSKNHISCIFLLSDGQHNEGPISMDILYQGDTERTKCEYTLTSFGYGDDHDAKLMQEMSEKKGGNYYFVDDISKVEDCFVDSLAMVTSILGQKIRANFKLNPTPLFPEIRFEKTYGPYWKSKSPIEAEVFMSSFFSGFNKNFLCLLGFNPVKEDQLEDETEVTLGTLELKIDTLTEPLETKIFKRTIKLRVLPHDSEELIVENEVVQEQITRVQGAEAIELSEQLNENRDYDQAIKVLDCFVADLDKKKFSGKELFVKMKKSITQQKEMISNNKIGRANAYKTVNFSMQTKNIYMNEQAAPLFSQALYQNSKMKRMSKY